MSQLTDESMEIYTLCLFTKQLSGVLDCSYARKLNNWPKIKFSSSNKCVLADGEDLDLIKK